VDPQNRTGEHHPTSCVQLGWLWQIPEAWRGVAGGAYLSDRSCSRPACSVAARTGPSLKPSPLPSWHATRPSPQAVSWPSSSLALRGERRSERGCPSQKYGGLSVILSHDDLWMLRRHVIRLHSFRHLTNSSFWSFSSISEIIILSKHKLSRYVKHSARVKFTDDV
jgi:hypothetical protein